MVGQLQQSHIIKIMGKAKLIKKIFIASHECYIYEIASIMCISYPDIAVSSVCSVRVNLIRVNSAGRVRCQVQF
jgi:uncharacterized membrane protein YwaF